MAFLFGNHGKKINIVDAVYPIGSIYLSVNSTNPSNFLGGGWTSWGSGRVPVGVDTSDTNFNTVEKTGGAKNVTPSGAIGGTALTEDQMPSHNHYIAVDSTGSAAVETGYAAKTNLTKNTKMGYVPSLGGTSYAGSNQTHTHSFTGTQHTNLQPYITCYMWKRVS